MSRRQYPAFKVSAVAGWFVLASLTWKGGSDTVRELFYKAFSSGNIGLIDKAIEAAGRSGGEMAQAYEGALLMKKADLVKGPGEKLKMFKKGHGLFEKEVAASPDNAELRFIRLCIQENAPKIVKYKGEIEEDKAFVIRKFASLPSEIRKQIRDYAASSEVLTPEDLEQ